MIAILTLALPNVSDATTSPAGHAASVVRAKVRSTYRHKTAGREVFVGCRRLHQRKLEFFCKYGVQATFNDATEGSGRWVYSGTADVQAPHGRLRASFTGPLRQGGEFAPFDPERRQAPDPAAIRAEEEAGEQAQRVSEQRGREEQERQEAATRQFCAAEPSSPICH